MLYSKSMDIGFAHYPKTAGHSLTRWFREVFPDARLVEPHPVYEVNHLPVRYSLEKLGLVSQSRTPSLATRHRITQACVTLYRTLARCFPAGQRASAVDGKPCATRIIGVVREPFEMLVSLFEYWRAYQFPAEPTEPLIRAARHEGFRRFLDMAVGDGGLATYESFFDMDGPASATTRLLDFNSLEPALLQVCREFGVSVPETKLGLFNVGPSRQRDLERYRVEAGTLLAGVRSHFRWYYDEGVRVMVTGNGAAAAASERRSQRQVRGPSSASSRKTPYDRGLRGSRWLGAGAAAGQT